MLYLQPSLQQRLGSNVKTRLSLWPQGGAVRGGSVFAGRGRGMVRGRGRGRLNPAMSYSEPAVVRTLGVLSASKARGFLNTQRGRSNYQQHSRLTSHAIVYDLNRVVPYYGFRNRILHCCTKTCYHSLPKPVLFAKVKYA